MPAAAAGSGRPIVARRSRSTAELAFARRPRRTAEPISALLVSRRVVDFVRITASGC